MLMTLLKKRLKYRANLPPNEMVTELPRVLNNDYKRFIGCTMTDEQFIMHRHDKQWYYNMRTIDSWNAGYTFGKLYQSYLPDVTLGLLERIIDQLTVKKQLDIDVYRSGFAYGYIYTSESPEKYATTKYRIWPLDDSTGIIPGKETTMGKLSTLKKQASKNGMLPFVRTAKLTEIGAIFCIEKIRKGSGQFGDQWYLDILLDNDSQEILNCNESGRATLTLSCSPRRDNDMEVYKDALPIHSATIVEIETKNGQTYNDILEAPSDCPCGQEWTPDEDEDDSELTQGTLGDLDDDEDEVEPTPPSPTRKPVAPSKSMTPPAKKNGAKTRGPK